MNFQPIKTKLLINLNNNYYNKNNNDYNKKTFVLLINLI